MAHEQVCVKWFWSLNHFMRVCHVDDRLANRYAHQLIQAREAAEFIPSLSSRYPLTIGDAYEIAARVAEIRIAEGENIVGRKLDYFLETSSDRIGKKNRLPFWSWLFDSGVRFMENQ